MDIILLFSLSLIQDFSQQGLQNYHCCVQRFSELPPKSTKRISIILKESENTSREEQTRNYPVAALQCSAPQGPMQVHFIVSEKMYRGKLKAIHLFYGLKQITDPDERGCAAKCCLISADHRKSLQRKAEASIMGKVLLPGVSDCVIISNQTNNENFARRLEKTYEIKINATCETDEMQYRKKIGVFLKIAILCILVPLMFFFMVFGICKVPCPCSLPCWMQCLFPAQKHEAQEKKKMTEATSPAALGIPNMVEV